MRFFVHIFYGKCPVWQLTTDSCITADSWKLSTERIIYETQINFVVCAIKHINSARSTTSNAFNVNTVWWFGSSLWRMLYNSLIIFQAEGVKSFVSILDNTSFVYLMYHNISEPLRGFICCTINPYVSHVTTISIFTLNIIPI